MRKFCRVHRFPKISLLLLSTGAIASLLTAGSWAQPEAEPPKTKVSDKFAQTESITRTDLQGIPTLPLPEKMSIFEYTKSHIYPFFKTKEYEQIQLSNNLSLCLYNKKTPQSKLNSDKAFQIEKLGLKDKEKEWLQSLLKNLEGRHLIFKKNSMTMEPPITMETPALSSLKLPALGRLLVAAMFSSKKGLILGSSYSQDKLYLVPLNKQNLRYLGIFLDKGFDDKTYSDYFREFEKVENLGTKKEIWATLMRGYNKEKFSKLNREEQQILHDTVGIFIAEEFRLLSRNSSEKVNQIMPAGMLITTYLQKGGKPLRGVRKKEQAGTVTNIPKSHEHFKLYWNYYDKAWSTYLEKKHPTLAHEIEKNFNVTSSVPKPNDPPTYLFQKLIDYVEAPKSFEENKERIFNQVLDVLWDESPNIDVGQFIPNTESEQIDKPQQETKEPRVPTP
jgi:hypothetical protein